MTTIIVPTYNQEQFTIKCFESILKNTCSKEYSVLWADDNSSKKSYDAVKPVFEKFFNRKHFRNYNNQGFIKTVNTAIKLSKLFENEKDSIILLNNDTEATKGWLPKMIKGLKNNSVIGTVSSCQTQWQGYQNLFGLIGIECSDLIERNVEGKLNKEFRNVYHQVSGVSFFCTAFRTKIFDSIGFVDDRFGKGYGEDTDFCRRVVNSGETIAISLSTLIYHHHHGTFNGVYNSKEMRSVKQKHLGIFKKKHNITGGFCEHKK